MPEEWIWLIEQGKLARPLAELLWQSDGLTEGRAECDMADYQTGHGENGIWGRDQGEYDGGEGLYYDAGMEDEYNNYEGAQYYEHREDNYHGRNDVGHDECEVGGYNWEQRHNFY